MYRFVVKFLNPEKNFGFTENGIHFKLNEESIKPGDIIISTSFPKTQHKGKTLGSNWHKETPAELEARVLDEQIQQKFYKLTNSVRKTIAVGKADLEISLSCKGTGIEFIQGHISVKTETGARIYLEDVFFESASFDILKISDNEINLICQEIEEKLKIEVVKKEELIEIKRKTVVRGGFFPHLED